MKVKTGGGGRLEIPTLDSLDKLSNVMDVKKVFDEFGEDKDKILTTFIGKGNKFDYIAMNFRDRDKFKKIVDIEEKNNPEIIIRSIEGEIDKKFYGSVIEPALGKSEVRRLKNKDKPSI